MNDFKFGLMELSKWVKEHLRLAIKWVKTHLRLTILLGAVLFWIVDCFHPLSNFKSAICSAIVIVVFINNLSSVIDAYSTPRFVADATQDGKFIRVHLRSNFPAVVKHAGQLFADKDSADFRPFDVGEIKWSEGRVSGAYSAGEERDIVFRLLTPKPIARLLMRVELSDGSMHDCPTDVNQKPEKPLNIFDKMGYSGTPFR
jgi:hypothetical protein